MATRLLAAGLWVLALVVAGASVVGGQWVAQPLATAVTPDRWPKTSDVNGVTYTMYSPQVDRWDGYHFAAHAVVAVAPKGTGHPALGVIAMQARTIADRQAQTVYFDHITVVNATFPGDPRAAGAYRRVFQQLLSQGPSSLPLARLTSDLAAGDGDDPPGVAVLNTPPQFIFSQSPAMLVLIDGDPVWRALPGTNLERVINTRALILRDGTGTIWVHLFDGFLTAPRITGPWSVATNVPTEAGPLAQNLADANVVDLMPGEPDETTNLLPSLAQGAPQLVVATRPTELLVTDGAPHWTSIPGTSLQYVDNTTGNVFTNLRDRQIYVLVTGRWFRASGFDGPWQYVDGRDLPADFANIPDDSPKENVKASIPSTPQADDALRANQVPQMTEVDPTQVHFMPDLPGAPVLAPIEGTPLQYVANSRTPIIRMNDANWYAVQDGIWFSAPAITGPWSAATGVPPVIYTIPPSSPLYYVTFVRIYDITPPYIVEGYTPGYLGSYASTDGVVVYGTGYAYPAYIVTYAWYPAPVTYGYAANICWTPWTGWCFGFGFGWFFGEVFDIHHQRHHWGWGPAPYWGVYGHHFYGRVRGGPGGWGPNSWVATNRNVYRRWNRTTRTPRPGGSFNAWGGNAWNTRVGHAYNSTTGRLAAGQHAPLTNVYTGNFSYPGRTRTAPGAPPMGGNLFSDRNGRIYRSPDNRNLQQFRNGRWNNVQDPQRLRAFQRQQSGQRAGDQRAAGSAWGGAWGNNFRPGAGHPSGGRAWNGGQFSAPRGNMGGFRGNQSAPRVTGGSRGGGGGRGGGRR